MSLPVLHTLFDGGGVGDRVAALFDIGAVSDCRLWRSFINDVYRLEADGRVWWLRIHPAGWRTRAQTQAEIDAILAIAAAGASVALPAALRDGSFQFEIDAPEGPRGAVLFEHAPGAELNFFGADAAANARRYGEAAARLHNACEAVAPAPGRTAMDLDFVLNRPVESLARRIDAADRTELERIAKRIGGMLENAALTRGFCHGDLNTQNIHFDGDRATVFDFDCSGDGWRAFELSGFARGITWRMGPSEDADRLIAPYYDSYRAHRAIAGADLEVQAAMLMAQRIWVGALHMDGANRWGAGTFGQPYADGLMAWLRQWAPALDTPPAWSRSA